MQKIIILVALMTYVTGIFAQNFSSQLEAKAKKGDVNAQYDLAVCYQKGLGITVNNKMAFTWFKKAAEKGSRYAQFNLGECYLKAIGTPVNEQLAFHWYQNALKNGNKDALPMLGLCYYAGKGAKIDYKKAVVYFRQSADAGSSLGKTCLGWCYAVNAGVDSADVNKAFSLWSDASVSESAKPIVSYLVGMFYLYSSQYYDSESAYGFLSSAANAPEPIGDAMQKTAYMEENGIGTSKNTVNASLLRRDYLKHNFTNEAGALLTEPLDYTSIPFQIQYVDGNQLVTTNAN